MPYKKTGRPNGRPRKNAVPAKAVEPTVETVIVPKPLKKNRERSRRRYFAGARVFGDELTPKLTPRFAGGRKRRHSLKLIAPLQPRASA